MKIKAIKISDDFVSLPKLIFESDISDEKIESIG
jgi:hypothetical protein